MTRRDRSADADGDPDSEADSDADPGVSPDAGARRLYEHLAATAELPVERHASRVLGEAEAVAYDLRECEGRTRRERARVVVELLQEIDGTGHADADDHVEEARTLAATLAVEP